MEGIMFTVYNVSGLTAFAIYDALFDLAITINEDAQTFDIDDLNNFTKGFGNNNVFKHTGFPFNNVTKRCIHNLYKRNYGL